MDGDGDESVRSNDSAATNGNLRAEEGGDEIARKETRAVSVARIVMVIVLLVFGKFVAVEGFREWGMRLTKCTAASLFAAGVYLFTRGEETRDFQDHFQSSAKLLIDSFHESVENQIGAVSSLSTTITSIARSTNQHFPFVTIDDFELLASHTRVSAKTVAVHWTPILKTESKRKQWEAYALQHRSHIDKAFISDKYQRESQDEEFNFVGNGFNDRNLQEPEVLNDGTGYRPRLWNVRTQDTEIEGVAPYAATWQRSPVNAAKQKFLNMNIANAPALQGGVVQTVIETQQVVINKAIVPVNDGTVQLSTNLLIGQYRHAAEEYVFDPISFMAYPVFDDPNGESKEVVGLVITNLYWRLHFTDILP